MSYHSYYVTYSTPVCPYCGSAKVVLDLHGGALVCRSCGAVIDDIIFDASPPPTASSLSSLSVNNRLTKTEKTRLHTSILSNSLSRRLSRILNTTEIDDIIDYVKANMPELIKAYNNACLRNLLKYCKTSSEKKAVLEAAITLMHGDYPLVSMLSSQYEVGKKRLRLLIRKVMKCLSLELSIEALAST